MISVSDLSAWGREVTGRPWTLREIRRAAFALGVRAPRTLTGSVMPEERARAVHGWLERQARDGAVPAAGGY